MKHIVCGLLALNIIVVILTILFGLLNNTWEWYYGRLLTNTIQTIVIVSVFTVPLLAGISAHIHREE